MLIYSIFEKLPYSFKTIYCSHDTCDISNWLALILTVILTGIAVFFSFWLAKIISKKLSYDIGEKMEQSFGKETSGSTYPIGSTKNDDTLASIEKFLKQRNYSSDQTFTE